MIVQQGDLLAMVRFVMRAGTFSSLPIPQRL